MITSHTRTQASDRDTTISWLVANYPKRKRWRVPSASRGYSQCGQIVRTCFFSKSVCCFFFHCRIACVWVFLYLVTRQLPVLQWMKKRQKHEYEINRLLVDCKHTTKFRRRNRFDKKRETDPDRNRRNERKKMVTTFELNKFVSQINNMNWAGG